MLVAGVDSSTQSTKILLCRAEDGAVVARGSAPHPGGTECDPAAWWSALREAGDGLLSRADAVAVAGQQHGMVVVDSGGDVIRPALLWNDLRSAATADALIAERGGPGWWAEHTGSVPNGSFTVTKLRWLAEHEPGNAARVTRVMLPHDWLTWRLGTTEPVTDRGDASGTGYFSPAAERWLPELAGAALGHEPGLPRVAEAAEAVGRDRKRGGARPGHRRQHGGGARSRPGAWRAGHLHRDVRDRLRRHRDARGRRVGRGRRVRGRDRALPPPGGHRQRGSGAVRRGLADRYRSGWARRPGARGGARRRRDHVAALSGR